jgi:uroporphyrinogen decarboxylase
LNVCMTPRERVNASLSFQEPDRVPTAIGGGPYGIVDETYFKLLKKFHLDKSVQPFRSGHNISYLDNRVLDRLGTDIRYVYPTISPSSPTQKTTDPDVFLDSFGQSWKRTSPYYYVTKGLLAEIHKIDQIEEKVNWPDPQDRKWFAQLKNRAEMIHADGSFWITARMVISHGPFQTACDLRGTENFLTDLALYQAFATSLLDKITNTICGLMKNYLMECGKHIHMIELPGDDYAGNEQLIISPTMFRKFLKPQLEKIVTCIRSICPRIKIMLHSDGVITKLIPDLIQCGIDVIHPLEPLPATNQAQVKKEYGHQIAFLGGIDIAHAMRGSEKDVYAEVQRCIQQLALGGGFILAPSNHLQADVPPENIIYLFNYCRSIGKYPIKSV